MSQQKTAIVFISLLLFGAVASFFWLDASVAQTRIVDHLPGDLSEFLQIVSKFGHGAGCVIALLLIAIFDRSNRRQLGLVLAAPLIAGIITAILKVAVLRPRPFVVDEVVRSSISFQEAFSYNALHSFPSGHTATAVALAFALSAIYPHGRILFAGLALTTCFQRIVAQCHFPSDVCVGAVIGFLSFYVAKRICDAMARRLHQEQPASDEVQPDIDELTPVPAIGNADLQPASGLSAQVAVNTQAGIVVESSPQRTVSLNDPNSKLTCVVHVPASFAGDWSGLSDRISNLMRSTHDLETAVNLAIVVDGADFRLPNEFNPQATSVFRSNLSSALFKISRDSTHIIVADAVSDVDTLFPEGLPNEFDNNLVACRYQSFRHEGKIWSRAVAMVTAPIRKLMLGTDKNNTQPGIALIDHLALRKLSKEGFEFDSTEQLISACRSSGQVITETRISRLNSGEHTSVSLKPTLREFGNSTRFWWQHIAFPARRKDESTRLETQVAKSQSWTRKTKFALSLTLFVAAALVLFSNLGYPLIEPDESRNAQIAMNIISSGDWMTLTLDGSTYWDKPPLQAWMTAASYTILGKSEFATRLPCAICSFLTLVVLLGLGSKLYGFRTAFYGAALLLMCSGFVVVARFVTMDATLMLLATTMWLSTMLAVREDRIKVGWLILAGAACGLGLMTKGPVIGVVVLPPILISGWLQNQRFFTRIAFWLYPALVAVLISAPWFLSMGIVYPDFIVHFFLKHNLARFSAAFNHQAPWWYYFPVIFLVMYPACFLLPNFVKHLFGSRDKRRQFGCEFGGLVLSVGWILLFFSMSESKLPTYILPAVPLGCLLLGRYLELLQAATRQETDTIGAVSMLQPNAIPRLIATSTLTALAILALVVILVLDYRDSTTLWLTGLLVGSGILLFGVSRKTSQKWACAFGLSIVFLVYGSAIALPKISEHRTINGAVAVKVEQLSFSDSAIVYFGRPPYAKFLYMPQREIQYFNKRQEVQAVKFLEQNPHAIVVASKGDVKRLKRHLGPRLLFEKAAGHRKLHTTRLNPLFSRVANKTSPGESAGSGQTKIR